MKTVTCDGCGTTKDVKEAFVTVWNGNIIDLCRDCSMPMSVIIDKFCESRWLRVS